MLMVPMAPLYLIIAVAILAFSNPIFLGILIYFIITWIYSFPSGGDFDMIRYAKVFVKYKYYDPTFIRFMETMSDSAVDARNTPDTEITITGPDF